MPVGPNDAELTKCFRYGTNNYNCGVRWCRGMTQMDPNDVDRRLSIYFLFFIFNTYAKPIRVLYSKIFEVE